MSDIQLASLLKDLEREFRQTLQAPIYVGFSGGVDSSLLLALACRAFKPSEVTAIHVNHGLSDRAQDWQSHCADQADQFGCHFDSRSVHVEPRGQGLESEARDRRYSVFSEVVGEGQTLLLGHHLDDQVETFFLRLLRGAGRHGLQGMAQQMTRDGYQIRRPLLTTSREEIERLAAYLGLSWIEDESNVDLRFDRNFLRQEILPGIEKRWPAYRQRILQTQQMLSEHDTEAESFNLADAMAHRLSHDQGLKMVQLDQLTRPQTLSLIHHWLVSQGLQVPSRARLEVILDEVVHARVDAQPLARVGAGTVQRHGPALYWVPDATEPGLPPSARFDADLDWEGIGRLRLQSAVQGPRLSADLPDLNFRLRAGGETLRPIGRSKSRDLKRLYQEYRIKPWLRDRTPLLFSGTELVAVGDELQSADHQAVGDQPGFVLQWQKSD